MAGIAGVVVVARASWARRRHPAHDRRARSQPSSATRSRRSTRRRRRSIAPRDTSSPAPSTRSPSPPTPYASSVAGRRSRSAAPGRRRRRGRADHEPLHRAAPRLRADRVAGAGVGRRARGRRQLQLPRRGRVPHVRLGRLRRARRCTRSRVDRRRPSERCGRSWARARPSPRRSLRSISPHDPIRWLLRDKGLVFEDPVWWMFRLLDAQAAIAGRGFPAGLVVDVPLELTDPQIASNGGRVRLTVADGAGAIEPDRTTRPAIELGPNGLAALYAGTPLSTLRRADLATGAPARRRSARRRVRGPAVHARLLLIPGSRRSRTPGGLGGGRSLEGWGRRGRTSFADGGWERRGVGARVAEPEERDRASVAGGDGV